MRTDRIILREIVNSDLNNIYRGLSNPEVIKYYGISFNSLEATKEQMAWYEKQEQMWWAICSNNSNVFYGAGGLNDINHEEKKAEIGLWLLPEYWGLGIMKDAFPLICKYGFSKLHLNRIEGFVETNNSKCKIALSKLDFQFEKTMKNDEMKNGNPISIDIYAKINH